MSVEQKGERTSSNDVHSATHAPDAPRYECKRHHAHETCASAIEPGPLARGRRAARCTAGFGGAKPFNYFCYGAALSEVELDALTGDWHLLRTDLAMDVGDSLNPAIDIGQARARARASRACRVFTHWLGSVAGAWRTGRAAFVECGFSVVALRKGLIMPLGNPLPTQPGPPGHDDAHRRACRLTASCAATVMRVRVRLGSRAMPRSLMLLCNASLTRHRKWQLNAQEGSFHSTPGSPFWALHESHDIRAGPMAALQACSGARRCGPGRRRGTARRAQVEGGFVQGLGWCCLEELYRFMVGFGLGCAPGVNAGRRRARRWRAASCRAWAGAAWRSWCGATGRTPGCPRAPCTRAGPVRPPCRAPPTTQAAGATACAAS
jgi:hypothetical protein